MIDKKLPNIEHLVLSGAAHGMYSYMGAFSVLIKHNIINIKKIKSIYGSSAGALLAVLLLIDIDIDVINDYFIERPWHELLKLDNFVNILSNYGLWNPEYMKKTFNPLFSMNDIDINITMLEFYEKTNVELYFYATELKSFEEIELSYKNTPDLKLLDAVYMSCSLPILFEPILYNKKYYIDGCLINSYPINNILNKVDDSNTIFGIKNTAEHTFEKFGELNNYEIQEMNKEDKLYENKDKDDDEEKGLTILDIIQYLILNPILKLITPNKSNLENELEIKSCGILTFNVIKQTNSSYDHRLELINRAKKETEDFIKFKYDSSL